MAFREEYERWLGSPEVSERDKEELKALTDEEIKSRFSSELEFGTAGIRRVMEVGPGSINMYTVKHITRALSLWLKNTKEDQRTTESFVTPDKDQNQSQIQPKSQNLSVVIAYDSRNNGKEYAEAAACVLAAQKIHVFLYEDLRPTPELSFAVRYSGSAAGINITASHNTKEYNGYKVYGSDGAQLSPEHAEEIASILDETDVLDSPPMMDYRDAVSASIIEEIDGYFDSIYKNQVLSQSKLNKDDDKVQSIQKEMKIIYTSFHGTGSVFLPEILNRDGFGNVICVEEQCIPDGDFPTVKSPNPENEESFKMAIELATAEGADLVIGTDPDRDRCGVAIRISGKSPVSSKGEKGSSEQGFKVLTGNQIGVILLDYLIKSRKVLGDLPKDAYACKSIVSTNMANRICEVNDIEMVETLTGFKFIGEKMEELSVKDGREFIFGFEESNGYLTGLYARDKDAILASMLVAEAVCFHGTQGHTMEEAMEELYKEYGYYKEHVVSKEFGGLDGSAKMTALMDALRSNPPKEFAGTPVIRVRDYLTGEIKGVSSDASSEPVNTKINLPQSNVLFYELAGGGSLVVRPSGTEPKVKIYLSVVGESHEDAETKFEALEKSVASL